MFEKKQIIFSETLGVCLVKDIPKLSRDRGPQIPYYLLRSVYDKTKIAYIPVEEHQVVLRELIDVETAQKECDRILESGAVKDTPETILGEIAYVLGKTVEELFQTEDQAE